jgi:hypothetical protein
MIQLTTNKTKQNKTKQNKTKQNKTKQKLIIGTEPGADVSSQEVKGLTNECAIY